MNKSSKLVIIFVTVFLLANLAQVECRRTYSSRSSSSGRGNRGKNQPSGGGLFSSWFGGSKSSSSSSGSHSKPISTSHSKPVSNSAKSNWQTATSQVSSQPKTGWANPSYKPAGSAVPSAPKEANYGWKPIGSNTGSSYPSSNIGSRGYPVQSGVQQSNVGGFKPASSVPGTHSTNYQPAQSSFGGYRPSSNVPGASNTHYQPSSSFGGTHAAPSAPNAGYQPSHGYQPSQGVPHQPYSPSYQPSGHHVGGYPQQTGSFPSHASYPAPSYSGYPVHNTFGGAAPSYQGNRLFGGSSGHYGYPTSGSWGLDTYGSKKSSGTGKLLTGLAVGAAGGYLTSSLVNSISNPWKYSGHGYGSGYGYNSSPGYGSNSGSLTADQSAFERGFERGIQSRQNTETKEAATPAPASPQPEDPSSKWIHCVAFDPQTQQTLINPNCSCTVTTSLDERTGQPLSVHHCTTLNGLVLQPIPIQPGVNPLASPVPAQPNLGVNAGASPVNGPQPPVGVNAPGVVPSYGGAYQGNSQYGSMQGIYLPEVKSSENGKSEAIIVAENKQEENNGTEVKAPETTTGTVISSEVVAVENVTKVENSASSGGPSSEPTGGLEGIQETRKSTE